jgi:uncharacterized membrane protein YbhN (UPF0104 family)
LLFADIGTLLATIATVDTSWYSVALICFLCSYLPTIYRWQLLQRTLGYDPTLVSTFEILAISLGLNKILPANAGDLTRSKLTQRYYDVTSHTELLSLVAVARLLDFVVALLLFCLGAFSVAATIVSSEWVWVGIGAGLAAAGLVIMWWGLYSGIRSYVPDVFTETVEAALGGVRQLTGTTFALVVVATVIRWLLGTLVFICVGYAVGYIPSVMLSLALISGMSLVSVLPITPGGIGASETAGVGILVAAGIAYPTAVTLALLQRTFGVLWMGAIGATVYIVRFGVRGGS